MNESEEDSDTSNASKITDHAHQSSDLSRQSSPSIISTSSCQPHGAILLVKGMVATSWSTLTISGAIFRPSTTSLFSLISTLCAPATHRVAAKVGADLAR